MTDKRIGRQLPTRSVVIPYSVSLGAEAVSVYERSGRSAMEWQQQSAGISCQINMTCGKVLLKYRYFIKYRDKRKPRKCVICAFTRFAVWSR